jgi:hypothetical protein
MRKLVVSEFISLDGVIQAPGAADEDRDGGFAHGGWTWPYWDDAIGETFGTFLRDADTVLLGGEALQERRGRAALRPGDLRARRGARQPRTGSGPSPNISR